MTIVEQMLAELEQEAQATRRVFERIPQAHLSWKPHAKSMSLGQLALHVATVPGNVAELAAMSTDRRRRTSFNRRHPARVGARPRRQSRPRPARARRPGRRRHGRDLAVLSGGRELMALPRAAFARAVMLNHWYHHRGQLLVYLRLLDLPVPSVYGPTADENPFAAPAEAGAR